MNSVCRHLTPALLGLSMALAAPTPMLAQARLNDLEMAHVAVVASNIDIAYAHLALAFSDNAEVRGFAETMIRDHSAVNAQVFALARKLGVTAQDNAVSRQLLTDADKIKDELSRLRGQAFDRRYMDNEARYHQAVNGLVAGTFLPNIQNGEVKQAFQGALAIFEGHQRHAESLARVAAR